MSHDVEDPSALHANLVHDVTDTDCQTQNGRAFATFKTSVLNTLDYKLTGRTAVNPSVFIPFLPIGSVLLNFARGPLYKQLSFYASW